MTDQPVLIAGRPFEEGRAYRSGRPPRRPTDPPEAPRRLLGYDPAFPWPDGRAEVARIEGPARAERRIDMSGKAWAAWAREVAA